MVLGSVAITKGIAWCLAALVAFPAGMVSASLSLSLLEGPARRVEVTLAGPQISAQGGRYVDFDGGAVQLSQVCGGTCDQVSLTYRARGHTQLHSWVRNADKTCISCVDSAVGRREKVRVDADPRGTMAGDVR